MADTKRCTSALRPKSELRPRAKRDAARMQLAADLDPAAEKKRAKVAARVVASNSFKAVAEEWLVKNEKEGRAPINLEKIRWLLRLAYPMIGSLPISKITAEEALAVLHKMEGNGRDESARRMRSVLHRLFRYGNATVRADRDVARDRRKLALYCARLMAIRAMRSLRWRSRSPIRLPTTGRTPKGRMGGNRYSGGALVAPSRYNEDAAPAPRPTLAPSLNVAGRSSRADWSWALLFPLVRSSCHPMSENTVNGALRRLGFKQHEMTARGFRAMAATVLNEMGLWNLDAIEKQPAYLDGSMVRRAYIRGEILGRARPNDATLVRPYRQATRRCQDYHGLLC